MELMKVGVQGDRIDFREPVVLEKNDNSDQVPRVLPVTQEFFRKVFSPSGPYWTLYSELGLSAVPERYVFFENSQMYFAKSIEENYAASVGMENRYEMRDGKLSIRKKLDIENLLLLLSAPFDILRQVKARIKLGFLANERIKGFEEWKRKSLGYYGRKITDPVKVARESLDFAVQTMGFSCLALLSHSQNIRLKESDSIMDCEAHLLSGLLENRDIKGIRKAFGFFSHSPYDISKPRWRENASGLSFGLPPPPEAYALKWRENARFICARYLDIERKALLMLGRSLGIGDLIFYSTTGELESLKDKAFIKRLKGRRAATLGAPELPGKLVCYDGAFFSLMGEKNKGISVSEKKVVEGRAVNINSFKDFAKFEDGSIIITRTLSPSISILFPRAGAVVSENGGALSHSALVARELHIPCIIQSEAAFKDGQALRVDGKAGTVEMIDYAENKLVERTATKLDQEEELPDKEIVWLNDPKESPKGLGGKAAALLLLAGLVDIPRAFCVTPKFFASPASDRIIKENYSRLKPPVAVRSSASVEDGKNASFAGQFDTYLGIKDFKALLSALKRCHDSSSNKRVSAYLKSMGWKGKMMMSVIVQEMVDSAYSGVMFTKKDSIRIEVVRGSGEKLVSGKVTPDSYIIGRKDLSVKGQRVTFSFDKARELAALGEKIEKRFGMPQDIEWAVDRKGKIWILQARPVTVDFNPA